ncbi:hypothetical protein Q8A64_02050 [Oxalobacteraceae bacterium R-40]|uniref:Uncharacterized protein n=1 Tax=Keguizhuia sedimenti TaxID=3064264 RepID=A0ABU1BL59_9BURK|nr:hypothetical protein [Oxalobacteraceae bacterium R-40]
MFFFDPFGSDTMQHLPPPQRKISSLILEEIRLLLTPKTVLVMTAVMALPIGVARFFF